MMSKVTIRRPNKRKLQAMINRCTRANNACQESEAALNAYCQEIYGSEPGLIDCDQIIDGCMGGCGMSSGMSADDFDQAMRSCL